MAIGGVVGNNVTKPAYILQLFRQTPIKTGVSANLVEFIVAD